MPLSPIPGPRDKKKFETAVAMLAWTLRRYHYRRRLGLKVSPSDPLAADRFIAMATLTRVAAGHAQIILGAARAAVAEGSAVNVRAMLELWADFRLIAKDPTDKTAHQAYLAGALAILRREPNAETEASLKKQFGPEFDTAAARHKKNPFGHWSGRSRKAVIVTECGADNGDLYEVVSWDCHPVVQVALDLQAVDEKAGKFSLGHREPQHEVAKFNCMMATHILRAMWNELVAQCPA